MSSIGFAPQVLFTASRTFCQEQSDLCSHLLNIFLGPPDFSVSISSKTCGSRSNCSPTSYQTAAIWGTTNLTKSFRVGLMIFSDLLSQGSAAEGTKPESELDTSYKVKCPISEHALIPNCEVQTELNLFVGLSNYTVALALQYDDNDLVVAHFSVTQSAWNLRHSK